MNKLAAPAPPPVPAMESWKAGSKSGITVGRSGVNQSVRSGNAFKLVRKLFLLLGGVAILLLLGMGGMRLWSRFTSPRLTVSQMPSPTPGVTLSPTPTETETDFPELPISVTQTPLPPDWKRLFSQMGSFWYDYPRDLVIKPERNLYQSLQPIWYDAGHYFDCINRQVGSRQPWPCWLLQVQITMADPKKLSALSPDFGKLVAFVGDPVVNYTDGRGRAWGVKGPVRFEQSQVLYAEAEINEVLYEWQFKVIGVSMREYLQTHPVRPFAQGVAGIDQQAVDQAQIDLLQKMLSTFVVWRKPFLETPTAWLRHRFSDNWSVAYPENWVLLLPEEAPFAAGQEGAARGWYGIGDAVSLHDYLVVLTTPNLEGYPPGVKDEIDSWVNYDLEQLSADQRGQVEVLGIPVRKGRRNQKQVTFATRTLLNMPNDLSVWLAPGPVKHPVHKAYIWELEGLPPRIVTVSQLDGGYEPEFMKNLLDLFVKRIYE